MSEEKENGAAAAAPNRKPETTTDKGQRVEFMIAGKNVEKYGSPLYDTTAEEWESLTPLADQINFWTSDTTGQGAELRKILLASYAMQEASKKGETSKGYTPFELVERNAAEAIEAVNATFEEEYGNHEEVEAHPITTERDKHLAITDYSSKAFRNIPELIANNGEYSMTTKSKDGELRVTLSAPAATAYRWIEHTAANGYLINAVISTIYSLAEKETREGNIQDGLVCLTERKILAELSRTVEGAIDRADRSAKNSALIRDTLALMANMRLRLEIDGTPIIDRPIFEAQLTPEGKINGNKTRGVWTFSANLNRSLPFGEYVTKQVTAGAYSHPLLETGKADPLQASINQYVLELLSELRTALYTGRQAEAKIERLFAGNSGIWEGFYPMKSEALTKRQKDKLINGLKTALADLTAQAEKNNFRDNRPMVTSYEIKHGGANGRVPMRLVLIATKPEKGTRRARK